MIIEGEILKNLFQVVGQGKKHSPFPNFSYFFALPHTFATFFIEFLTEYITRFYDKYFF